MSANTEKRNSNLVERPPVVVVMGHVDHGKSTLLDYIRETNVVEKEAGGITQHISAYEIIHKNEKGADKKITFLDTPGHAAFSQMRERGAFIADIAVLVVSAEDKVQAQTIEALDVIKESDIPFIVAINKIDKSGANVEKTKTDLVEKGIYIEGYGGDIPCVETSAKTGQGVDELLNMILLVAELEELKGDLSKNATGLVIESDIDPKRGISASLIIKDGVLRKGMFVVVEDALAGTRIFENCLGKEVEEASFSMPVKITGFTSSIKILGIRRVPRIGEIFLSFETKKEAEEIIRQFREGKDLEEIRKEKDGLEEFITEETKILPLIIKTDVSGTIEAIEKEVHALNTKDIAFKIIHKEVGDIGESDVKLAASDKDSTIIGFNVKVDSNALELNEQLGVSIQTFDIIYKIIDWLKEEMERQRPRKEIMETVGKAKVLKVFSQTKDKQVIGGKVLKGKITSPGMAQILRRDTEIGQGHIIELQQNKMKIKEVEEEAEFGMMIESKIEIAEGDILESYIIVSK